MISVSNTSPLIFASKVPKILDLLKDTYEGIVIPPEVYKESVDEALKSDKPGVRESGLAIKKLVDDGFVMVKELDDDSLAIKQSFTGVGEGEASAIALAVQEKIKYILVDEKRATTIAKSLGLKIKPISILPVEACRKGLLGKNAAIELLDELIANQYRLSIKDYKKIMALLEG